MSITRKKLLIVSIAVLALALALVTVAGCGGGSGSGGASGSAATPFKVGVAGPMTGQYATYGASHKAGAEIAMAELNAAGGVNGGQVSIAIGDDLGDPKEAVLVASRRRHTRWNCDWSSDVALPISELQSQFHLVCRLL